jgi:hypothetical protein
MHVCVQCMSFHRDCAFRTVTRLQEEYHSSIPGRGCKDIQSGSGALATSYPMGSNFPPGGKAEGARIF